MIGLETTDGAERQLHSSETEGKGPKPGRQTNVRLRLFSVWKGPSLPYWPIQPYLTLYQSQQLHSLLRLWDAYNYKVTFGSECEF